MKKKVLVIALCAIYLWAPLARAGDRITAEMAMAATDKAFAMNARAAEMLRGNVNVLENTMARIDPLVLEYQRLDSENDAKRQRIAASVKKQLCEANQIYAATVEGRKQMEMIAEYAAQVACNASSLQGELEQLETAYEIGKLLSFGLGFALGYAAGGAGAGASASSSAGGHGGHAGHAGHSVNGWTGATGHGAVGHSVNGWTGAVSHGHHFGAFAHASASASASGGMFPLLIPFGFAGGGRQQSCVNGACTVAQPCQTCIDQTCKDCKDGNCKDCKECLECEEDNFDDVPDDKASDTKESSPSPAPSLTPIPDPYPIPPAPFANR